MEEKLVEIEVTSNKAIKVWWSITWRYCFFQLVGYMVFYGFVNGVAPFLLGEDASEAMKGIYKGLGGLIIIAFNILISIVAVQLVLKKKYSDFRIVLVERNDKLIDEQ